MLSLTLAVLLVITGAASLANGLTVEEGGHHAVEGHGDAHADAASVEACCDAPGTSGGGCLIDVALAGATAPMPARTSRPWLVIAAPHDTDGRMAAVPTGPPKVRALPYVGVSL